MKLTAFMLAAATALLPLPAMADGPAKLADFPLAARIKEKIASGKPLNIYVSYHDVSNEFAPEIKGIPVVTFNTDNPNSKRLAFAGQDLVQSGREAGKLMGKVLDGKGKVMITTIDAAAQWSLDREKGAREGLKAFPGIEVVKTLNTGTDPQKIYSAIENAMLANPGITGILSMECCSTPAAGTWVQRNKKSGQIKVVGFDLLDQTVQLVKSGDIQATIDQAPEKQGYEAVDLLVKFLHGEPIQSVDTGVGVYTKDNIDKVAKK
jgi:simple sugar transport system substrate-binding protein